MQACVYQAVRSALTVEIPNTSGAFRPIHVLTRPGSIAEVVMPGASSMRGVTGFRVLDAVNGALAQLIPERVGAAGEGGNTLAIFGAERPEGRRPVRLLRARRRHLGRHAGRRRQRRARRTRRASPRTSRSRSPRRSSRSSIERYGLVPDSGGAGLYRGGLAVERAWRCLTAETSLIVRSDRSDHPPYGLQGGEPRRALLEPALPADGSEIDLPSMFSTTIRAGDVYVHRTAGGGGSAATRRCATRRRCPRKYSTAR